MNEEKMVNIFKLKKRIGKSTKDKISQKYKDKIWAKRYHSWLSNSKRVSLYSLG